MSAFISNMELVFNHLLIWVTRFIELVVSQPVMLAVIALFVLRKIFSVFKAITG